ncbi:PREDICTED: matrix metalloproteinase-28-like [Priapulus caudatus]|uniref:Matrix metalloproteinase-28-like n=1 Tax=Priapulus caudatus TaxID=37621 RepID=A0ABM1EHW2_PRICU|nr:PREDICTED: matrix metalloproteinase-28-like [Priapulus caudatus]
MAAPVPGASGYVTSGNANVASRVDAEKYLESYGYLKPGQKVTDRDFTEALRMFQKKSGLPESNELDKETMHQMNLIRCGVKDVEDESDVRGPAPPGVTAIGARVSSPIALDDDSYLRRWWYQCNLTFALTKGTHHRSDEEHMNMIESALKQWEDALREGARPHPDGVTSALTFTALPPAEAHNAELQFSFEPREHRDGNAFDGPFGVLAHAFYPYVSGKLIGKIHFDGDENWAPNKLIGRTFYYVTLHELGHSLGLNHSDLPSSIMYPFVRSGLESNVALMEEDKQRIRDLYPTRLCDLFNNARGNHQADPRQRRRGR